MEITKTTCFFCYLFGCLLIFVGIFLNFYSAFMIQPGSGTIIDWNWFLISISMIIAGTIVLIIAIKMKRSRLLVLSILLVLLSILFYNAYYVINLDDGYKPASIYLEIDSFNDTENMIKWIVTYTYGEINSDDFESRLVKINSSYNPVEANIIYHDNDNSDSITEGDIFEVYAPEDEFYNFYIINTSTDTLLFSSRNEY